MVHKFKDALIVVGEKTLWDSLNNKIVENFGGDYKQHSNKRKSS